MGLSFGKTVGLVLNILGIILILFSFISTKAVLSPYVYESWSNGGLDLHHPSGLHLMDSWFASNGTTLVYKWEATEDVHVYAGKYEAYSTGTLLDDYLGHAYAKNGSMTIYANEKGDYVFAIYSPEDFSIRYESFKAIIPLAKVEKDNNLAYLGALVALLGTLILVFPFRARGLTKLKS